MAKDVKFGDVARQKLLAGVNVLSDAVRITLGGAGAGRRAATGERQAGFG